MVYFAWGFCTFLPHLQPELYTNRSLPRQHFSNHHNPNPRPHHRQLRRPALLHDLGCFLERCRARPGNYQFLRSYDAAGPEGLLSQFIFLRPCLFDRGRDRDWRPLAELQLCL